TSTCLTKSPNASRRRPRRSRLRLEQRNNVAAEWRVRLCLMALTDYVTLGRSGLRVSPFCLGTMTFGEDWGWGSTPAESAAILGRFLGRGGNFIDTANV